MTATTYQPRHAHVPKHLSSRPVDACRGDASLFPCDPCSYYKARHRKPIPAVTPSALHYPRAHRSPA